MLPVSEDYKSDALTISVNFWHYYAFVFSYRLNWRVDGRRDNMRLVYRGAKIQLANLVTIGKLDDKNKGKAQS